MKSRRDRGNCSFHSIAHSPHSHPILSFPPPSFFSISFSSFRFLLFLFLFLPSLLSSNKQSTCCNSLLRHSPSCSFASADTPLRSLPPTNTFSAAAAAASSSSDDNRPRPHRSLRPTPPAISAPCDCTTRTSCPRCPRGCSSRRGAA